MKYYLLLKALKFDRFFDSIEEIDSYILAKISARFFSVEFIKAHLEDNTSYSFLYRGIDIAIYRNFVHHKTHANAIHGDPAQENTS